MSAPTFTPAPWHVQDEDDRQSEDTFPVFTADGFEVCEVYGWETHRHPMMTVAQGEANAHLIAAAPELYAELQQFVNGVETRMIDSPADEALANITMRAKAALAKARGEQ